jgi:RNA polymerase sigma-70 factor (ECF subfamily)
MTATMRAAASPAAPAPRDAGEDRVAAIAAMQRYCVEGDAGAFAALYSIAAPRLFRSMLFLTRNRAMAEDVLQQTFLKLHRHRRAYVAGADPLPWLRTIAYRMCLDELRRARRERMALADAQPGDLEQLSTRDGGAAHARPTYSERAIVATLRALDRLPEAHRTALILTKLEGNTIEEAAALLGTTPTAIKLRAHRGYQRLRMLLRESATVSDD